MSDINISKPDSQPGTYTHDYVLTAGLTNAQGEMPLTLIVAHAIETATIHANNLGIGYSELQPLGLGWVLARISIEIYDLPAINNRYSMTTWIAGMNRFFSDRCYAMRDTDGRLLAAVRSVWVAIDINTRSMAELTALPASQLPVEPQIECPIRRCMVPAIAPDSPTTAKTYTFSYTDIDFNRHVNTLRYLEAVLNTRSLDFYDHNRVTRADASFERECHYGREVNLITGRSARDREVETTRIVTSDGTTAVTVALRFEPR